MCIFGINTVTRLFSVVKTFLIASLDGLDEIGRSNKSPRYTELIVFSNHKSSVSVYNWHCMYENKTVDIINCVGKLNTNVAPYFARKNQGRQWTVIHI